MHNYPRHQATPQLMVEYWKNRDEAQRKLAKARSKKAALAKKLFAADCDILTYEEVLYETKRVIAIHEGLPIAISSFDDSPNPSNGDFYIAGWDAYYRARFYRNVRDVGLWGLGYHYPSEGGGPSREHHCGHHFPSFEVIQKMSIDWLVRNYQQENKTASSTM